MKLAILLTVVSIYKAVGCGTPAVGECIPNAGHLCYESAEPFDGVGDLLKVCQNTGAGSTGWQWVPERVCTCVNYTPQNPYQPTGACL